MGIFILLIILSVLIFGASKVKGTFFEILIFFTIVILIGKISEFLNVGVEVILIVLGILLASGIVYLFIFHRKEWDESKRIQDFINEKSKQDKNK